MTDHDMTDHDHDIGERLRERARSLRARSYSAERARKQAATSGRTHDARRAALRAQRLGHHADILDVEAEALMVTRGCPVPVPLLPTMDELEGLP